MKNNRKEKKKRTLFIVLMFPSAITRTRALG